MHVQPAVRFSEVARRSHVLHGHSATRPQMMAYVNCCVPLQSLRAAADRMVALIADPHTIPEPAAAEPEAPVSDLQALAALGADAGWQGVSDGNEAAVGDEAADMAVGWLSLLRRRDLSEGGVQCAMAGLAAAVLVCSVPRCECTHNHAPYMCVQQAHGTVHAKHIVHEMHKGIMHTARLVKSLDIRDRHWNPLL